MRKIIVSEWISLDGIFDDKTMAQWYMPFDSEQRQHYIRDGIQAADAFLFGRNTYEMLYPYWSSLKNNEMGVAAKLNSAPKYVVSNTLKKAVWNNSTIISGDLEREILRLKDQPGAEIQVEGSATLVKLLSGAGLVDEYRFLVHPIIAGKGARLFREGMSTEGLQLIRTEQLSKGVIVLYYSPA